MENIDLNHWLLNDLTKDQLVLTADGLFRDFEYSGTCLITNNKVYRLSQYVKIGNWLDWLKYLKNNPSIESIFEEIYFDMGDFDYLADGLVGVKNYNHYYPVACNVPYSYLVHEAIKFYIS